MAFTTGELAKACQVSIKTVQFYDKKGLLPPSGYTDGGRRLYSRDDLQKLRLICSLKDMGFSLNDIHSLLNDDEPKGALISLIKNHKKELEYDIQQKEKMIDNIVKLTKDYEKLTGEDKSILVALKSSQNHIEHYRFFKIFNTVIMTNGILYNLIFWLSIFYHNWILALITFIVTLMLIILLMQYYIKKVSFMCSNCQMVFKSKFWEFARAKHTLRTRFLNCPSCQCLQNCIEILDNEEEKKCL